jgi:hypothetical protein
MGTDESKNSSAEEISGTDVDIGKLETSTIPLYDTPVPSKFITKHVY